MYQFWFFVCIYSSVEWWVKYGKCSRQWLPELTDILKSVIGSTSMTQFLHIVMFGWKLISSVWIVTIFEESSVEYSKHAWNRGWKSYTANRKLTARPYWWRLLTSVFQIILPEVVMQYLIQIVGRHQIWCGDLDGYYWNKLFSKSKMRKKIVPF